MRKKLLSLPILLLLTLSLLSALNVNVPGVSASGSPGPVIRVADPGDLTKPANISGGTNFNVSIFTNYTGGEVWGYEFSLTYNPLVLNITTGLLNVTNEDLISKDKNINATFIPGDFDNTLGTLSLTTAFFYYAPGDTPYLTSGNGTLANVNFTVVGTGDSYLTLGPETRLVGINASTGAEYNIIDTTMAGQIQDGYFFNTGVPPTHDIGVTSVTPNETGVLAGEFVDIEVNVTNTGTADETFDVDLYYSFWLIETRNVPVLPAGEDTSLIFTWNTTLVSTANYTITATAGPVAGETATTDNTGTHDKVFVLSPSVSIIPESVMDIALTPGELFTVSIYTDYDGTLIGRTDVWGYEFTLNWTAGILNITDVTNGGNLSKTETWTGDGTTTGFTTTETPFTGTEEVYVGFTDNLTDLTDGTTTIFTTTETPILEDSETVLVNQNTMYKPDNYTITYETGTIEFTTAPAAGVELIVAYMALMTTDNYTITDNTIDFTTAPADAALVKATYLYNATLLTSLDVFTVGTFDNVNGELSPTSANVSALETGPGVLATVTFKVTDFGDADITLGPETRLIGSGSFYNITLPHRLEHGFFTNGIDLKVANVVPSASQANPTWTVPLTIDVIVINDRDMSTSPFNMTLYYVNAIDAFEIGNESMPGLGPFEDKSFTLEWTLTDVDWGLYNITAEITATNDLIPANDVLVYSNVKITYPGDIDGDGAANDFDDFFYFSGFYPSLYDVDADINYDGLMTFDDFFIFTGYYPRPAPITYTY